MVQTFFFFDTQTWNTETIKQHVIKFFKVWLFAPHLIHLVNDAKLLISFVTLSLITAEAPLIVVTQWYPHFITPNLHLFISKCRLVWPQLFAHFISGGRESLIKSLLHNCYTSLPIYRQEDEEFEEDKHRLRSDISGCCSYDFMSNKYGEIFL